MKITLTVFAGTGGVRQIDVDSGVALALRLDKWAEGAAAMVLSVPPGTVTVDMTLVGAARSVEPHSALASDEAFDAACAEIGRAVLAQLGEKP